jgi:hypothetical protein
MLSIAAVILGLLQMLAAASGLSPTGVAAQPQAASSSERTYTNRQYGFSIRFPAPMSPATADYGAGHPFATMPVVYFAADDGAQTEGYLTVNVSAAAAEVAACLKPGAFNDNGADAKLTGASKVTIGKVALVRSDRSDGGGPLGLERDYTTLHNRACYDIQVTAYAQGCVNSGCTDRQWSLATETALLNKLNAMVQSFAFN